MLFLKKSNYLVINFKFNKFNLMETTLNAFNLCSEI